MDSDNSNSNINTYLFPIGYSIPEEKILDEVPVKYKMISSLYPGDKTTYIYNTEEEYYDEYRKSIFAYTFKKGGWDCMRHYEILACGCIPYFPDICECPNNILIFLPKDLIIKGNELFSVYKDKNIFELSDLDREILYEHIKKLLHYTRTYLTTKSLTNYFIRTLNNKVNIRDIKKILFISAHPWSEYLRCSLLHGLKNMYGKDCHDYPKIRHLYKNEDIDYVNYCYGRGYSHSNLLDQSLRDDILDNSIEEDIKNKKYDIIVWPDFHRWILNCAARPYFEFYDLAQKYYDPKYLVFLNGWDRQHETFVHIPFVEKGHSVFVREFLG